MSPSDFTLLQRWQTRRDAKAFQEIISRHAAMVYATCRRILCNAADAEEVAQECFFALAQGNDKNVRILGGWLHALATHKSLDRLRTDKRRQQRERQYAAGRSAHVEPTWNEIQEYVDEAIANLPERLSCVIVGHFLEGQSQADLARALTLSPSAVSRRIDRAVKQIRKVLRKQGVTVGATLLPALLAEGANETAPATLVASLGKLALAGTGSLSTTTLTSTTASAATVLAVKYALPVVALATFATLGYLVATQPRHPSSGYPSPAAEPTPSAGTIPELPHQESQSALNADVETEKTDSIVRNGGAVSGVVMDVQNKEPVSGVQVVVVRKASDDRHQGMSDAQGRFSLSGLAAGRYTANVSHTSFLLRKETGEFEVVSGRETLGIVLELARGATISGRVYDAETGEGIAGEQVIAGTVDEGMHGWMGPRTNTDADGRYVFSGVDEGVYHMMRYGLAQGYPRPSSRLGQQERRTVSVRLGETLDNVDIAVRRGICISGVVCDSLRQPLEGAHLRAMPERQGAGIGVANGSTDKQGAFVVSGVESGEPYVLSISKEGFAGAKLSGLEVGPEGLDGLEVILRDEATAEGMLVTSDDSPVKDAIVNFEGVDGVAFASGDTDEEGRFVVSGIPAGGYQVKARRLQSAFPHAIVVGGAPPALHITEGQHLTGLRFVLRNLEEVGLPISGRVTNSSGRPLEKVYVKFWKDPAEGERAYTFTAFSDENGDYTVHVTTTGTYSVAVNKPEYTHLIKSGIEAGSSAVNFVLRGTGAVVLRVVDARTIQPVTRFGYMYTYEPQLPIGYADYRPVEHPDGLLELDDIEERPFRVRVQADGYRTVMRTIEGVREGQVLSGLEIALQPGGQIECSVHDPTGAQLTDARVRVSRVGAGSSSDAIQLGIGADGRFRAQSLPDEPLVVRAEHDRYAAAHTVIEPSESVIQMELVLSEGSIIEGSVTIDGVPASNRKVSIVYLDESAAQYTAVTDEFGWYQHDLLPEGPVAVTVLLPEDVVEDSGSRLTADVRDAASTSVDFNISTTGTPP